MQSLNIPSTSPIGARAVFYISLALPGLVILRKLLKSKKHHPPSPLSLPFIGHLLSVPADTESIAFSKLGKQLNSVSPCYYHLFMTYRNSNRRHNLLTPLRARLCGTKLCTGCRGAPRQTLSLVFGPSMPTHDAGTLSVS
jgi:hypothetical protein